MSAQEEGAAQAWQSGAERDEMMIDRPTTAKPTAAQPLGDRALGDRKAGEPDRKTNLGRGLAALFGDENAEPDGLAGNSEGQILPLEMLHPSPRQPRRRFEDTEIEALAESIKENGILQPILVRPHPQHFGEYEIVAGERRWRAAQRARLHDVPVVVKALEDSKALEIAILENVQRQDLTALEESEGYHALLEEHSYTQSDLARCIGKSRSHIANALRLLNLPDNIKALVDDGALSAGHARALLTAVDIETTAQAVITRGLSVRQTEALVRRGRSKSSSQGRGRPKAATGAGIKDANTIALERDLSALLGLRVAIEIQGASNSERGAVTIHYESLEQLDDVLRRLHQTPPTDNGN